MRVFLVRIAHMPRSVRGEHSLGGEKLYSAEKRGKAVAISKMIANALRGYFHMNTIWHK